MAIKQIKKSIVINAPQIKVWNTLFSDETYPKWAAMFMEGSQVETDWQEGSIVKFTDAEGSGLMGVIEKNQPFDFLKIEYKAVLNKGIEDRESVEAKEIMGATESYILSESPEGTQLSIKSDMSEQYFDMMSAAWDKALEKVKQLSTE